jgi:hypothetical protein
MTQKKQKLPNRNVFSDIQDFIKCYQTAKGKDPERILLTPTAVKQYRKKLKLDADAILQFRGIPIVEDTHDRATDRN